MEKAYGAMADSLRRKGLRSTLPGRTLLGVLKQLHRPATAKTIHQAMHRCRCDLATVHRLLARFERTGLVRATHLGGQSRWFESAEEGNHVHHLVCERCRHIEPFEHCGIKKIEIIARRKYGFQICSHSVEFFGLCRRCQRRNGSS